MYDARLVRAAQEGDEAAFAALYDRCVDTVYDLCWWLTGDVEEASRLVTDAFVLAAEHLEELTDPSQLRPWLLAIARDRALGDAAEGSLRSGWGLGGHAGGGIEPLGPAALRDWVGEATALLALEDQAVVLLQLRYGLDDEQLAATIDVAPHRLAGTLSEVDADAEGVLSALVLARQGRQDCPELAVVLADWDGAPSVEVGEAAGRHAGGCARCSKRRKLVSPLEMMAELPVTVAPSALRSRVLEESGPALAALADRSAALLADRSAALLADRPADRPADRSAAGSADRSAVPLAADPEATAAMPALAAAGPIAAAAAAATAAAGTAATPAAAMAAAAAPHPAPATAPATRYGTEHRTPPMAALVGIAAGLIVLIGAVILVLRSPGSPKTSGAVHVLTPTTEAASLGATPQTLQAFPSTTTTSTPPPGTTLGLSSGRADLGATATSAEVILSDSSATPAAWRASWSAAWLGVSPASGHLAAGQTVPVTFTVNRKKAPAGPFDVKVVFTASGAGGQPAAIDVVGDNTPTSTTSTSTTLAGTVSVSNVSANPSTVYTTPCTPLRPTTSTVTATVTDTTGGTPTVTLSYTMPDGSHASTRMSSSGGGQWSGGLPPTATPGTITYQVSATDGGPTSTSGTHDVTVVSCT